MGRSTTSRSLQTTHSFLSQSLHSYQSTALKMKFFATCAALAALPIAFAAPSTGKSCPVAKPKPGHGKGDLKDFPFCFTSTYQIVATPDQVVNANNTATPGESGAIGYYNYGIQSEMDLICWHITLKGVIGPYQSPARTATHIRQANKGMNGPPRIAFPNPEPADTGADTVKVSMGCMVGPFTTGVLANGTDTGAGFTVKQIEENPSNFFTDAHTTTYVAGVVRGQMASKCVCVCRTCWKRGRFMPSYNSSRGRRSFLVHNSNYGLMGLMVHHPSSNRNVLFTSLVHEHGKEAFLHLKKSHVCPEKRESRRDKQRS